MNMKRIPGIIFLAILMASASGAHGAFASATNGVIPAASYAWGENFGWINFGCTDCNVSVTDSAVTGYAWSNQYGWINLSPTNGGVTNDGNGNLGGNAWSSGLGWISFSGVVINSSGQFTGIAGTQGSTAGRINFGCTNCNVSTDWQPASVRNQSGNSNNAVNTGGSISSNGGFLSGFLYLFNNNPFGNANAVSVNPVNVENSVNVNVENPAAVNPEAAAANSGGSRNSAGAGTLSAYNFPAGAFATSATSTRYSSVAAGTRPQNQPAVNAGSGRLGALSPLSLGIASSVLLIVILILRFIL